jgi:carboxymethylenebutenolidase
MKKDIVTQTLHIPVNTSGRMRAYSAKPAQPGKFPLIFVGMEIYGINDNIKDITRRVARLGYLAVAIDFYHRSMPGRVFTAAERDKALALVYKLKRDEVIADIRSAMDFFKTNGKVTDDVGFLGISIGGHFAYLAAAKVPIAATVIFYGTLLTTPDVPLGQPEATINLTGEIAKHNGKILFFVGSLDHIVKPDQVEDIKAKLKETDTDHEVIVYPGAKHRFFNDRLPQFYDREASDDAWEKTVRFFKAALAPEKRKAEGGSSWN